MYVCRKATNILFHLVLHSSFTSPTTMRTVTNQLIDITAPVFAGLIFAGVYGMRARYPMDSEFFLSLTACSMMLVYIGSVFLTVQFRGDYGVMTDTNERGGVAATVADGGARHIMNSIQQDQQQQPLRARTAGGVSGRGGESFNNIYRVETGQEVSVQDMFFVPMGDLNLLFSQIGYSYGSKLYNMRDDFKDL